MSDSVPSVRYRTFRYQTQLDDHRYRTECPPMGMSLCLPSALMQMELILSFFHESKCQSDTVGEGGMEYSTVEKFLSSPTSIPHTLYAVRSLARTRMPVLQTGLSNLSFRRPIETVYYLSFSHYDYNESVHNDHICSVY
jgi:hypothetical protein